MAKIYYENDADMSLIEDKTIGIVGYGSQGHAHALNLHDSGLNVMVGLYEGSSSIAKAESDGLNVGMVEDMARESDIIMMLIPDHIQAEVYRDSILPHLLPGKTLMFAHGFNIHYDWIQPPDSVDVSMVAPKAPGHRMREVFTRGSGVPGLLAVHQDVSGNAEGLGLAYARGVGCTRAWRSRNHLQGRDRDRLVRRAGGTLRRRRRTGQDRVRDAGGSGLLSGVGVLRVYARAQAHS